jgi:hypothetical protein
MRILNLCKEEMSIESIQASQELETAPLTATKLQHLQLFIAKIFKKT